MILKRCEKCEPRFGKLHFFIGIQPGLVTFDLSHLGTYTQGSLSILLKVTDFIKSH